MLGRSQVQKLLPKRPDELQYEKLRPTYPDTAEGQWTLAQWCFEHKLTTQRNVHLQRTIELDTNHEEARRALGYSHSDGKWTTRAQVMEERGYVLYKGHWHTAQEIELIEQEARNEENEKKWAINIKRWRKWLDSASRYESGHRNLMEIDDPNAVAALTRMLWDDPVEEARILYIEVLANIGSDAAIETLAICSMEDPIEEVRLTCLDYLEKDIRPDAVSYYVGKLRSKKSSNVEVNWAAVCLGRLKPPSAVGPLIDALVTTHKMKVSSGNQGTHSATFGTGPGGSGAPGGGGLSMGGKPRFITRTVPNQSVLDALVTITRQNFNFDQRAWSSWHGMQKKRVEVNARRDL